MTRLRHGHCGLALATLLVWPLAAQQPTFRAGVELIEIDAVVTGADGNPVTGLTAEDFEIVEDGTPQTIAAFSTVNIPIARSAPAEAGAAAVAPAPEVQTNLRADGRVYVIALDDIPPPLVERTRVFIRRFIERYMEPGDVASIAYLGRGSGSSQNFTGSQQVLLDAVNRFSGFFSGENTTATTIAAPQGDGNGIAAPTIAEAEARVAQSEGMFNLRSRMRALRSVTESLARIPGRRKAMLLVGTGATIVDPAALVDYNGGVMPIEMVDAHAALQAASRGHVAIYPIDTRGLSTGATDQDLTEAPSRGARQAAAGLRLTEAGSLRMMAEVTGGFAFLNQNSFDTAFARLVQENSSYYIIGFDSTNERRDGRFRNVQVRAKRTGLQVRARRGYLADTTRVRASAGPQLPRELSPATAEAFASPVAARGLPLTVFAAPFRAPGREVTVPLVIGIDPATLELVNRDGAFTAELEIVAGAVAGGTVTRTEYHVTRLALKPETLEAARTGGLQVLTAVSLPPGHYQIRTAAGNRLGRAGSVVHDLHVPDYSKLAVAMSGVAITSAKTSQSIALRHKDPLRRYLPGTPTSLREFDGDDTLALFVEVYDNLPGAGSHIVDLNVTLMDDKGDIVTSTFEERAPGESKGPGGGTGFTIELPLERPPAGNYILRLDAQTDADDSPMVRRDVPIKIR